MILITLYLGEHHDREPEEHGGGHGQRGGGSEQTAGQDQPQGNYYSSP